MNKFYLKETLPVARIINGSWDVLMWPAAGVYFFIALGIKLFSIQGTTSRIQALYKGAILGMVIYGVYDFTNLSLVNQWPLQMSLVDVIWGAVLCGATSFIAYERRS